MRHILLPAAVFLISVFTPRINRHAGSVFFDQKHPRKAFGMPAAQYLIDDQDHAEQKHRVGRFRQARTLCPEPEVPVFLRLAGGLI